MVHGIKQVGEFWNMTLIVQAKTYILKEKHSFYFTSAFSLLPQKKEGAKIHLSDSSVVAKLSDILQLIPGLSSFLLSSLWSFTLHPTLAKNWLIPGLHSLLSSPFFLLFSFNHWTATGISSYQDKILSNPDPCDFFQQSQQFSVVFFPPVSKTLCV